MNIKKKISECLFFSLGLSKENMDTLRGKKKIILQTDTKIEVDVIRTDCQETIKTT